MQHNVNDWLFYNIKDMSRLLISGVGIAHKKDYNTNAVNICVQPIETNIAFPTSLDTGWRANGRYLHID